MRRILAISLLLTCFATAAHAWIHDVGKGHHWPPDDQDWDGDSYPLYATSGFSSTEEGKAKCAAEGRRIMQRIAEIRADPGLMTRPDVVDGRVLTSHADAINNTKKWKYFQNWQYTRCREIWIQLSDKPLNSDDFTTYQHATALEGYLHVQRTAVRASIGGPWKLRIDAKRYDLAIQAVGDGFHPLSGDTMPIQIVATVTGAGATHDQDGILQGTLSANRVLQGALIRKNGSAAPCQLTYALDGRRIEGTCTENGQTMNWVGVGRGAWPAPAATVPPAP